MQLFPKLNTGLNVNVAVSSNLKKDKESLLKIINFFSNFSKKSSIQLQALNIRMR